MGQVLVLPNLMWDTGVASKSLRSSQNVIHDSNFCMCEFMWANPDVDHPIDLSCCSWQHNLKLEVQYSR